MEENLLEKIRSIVENRIRPLVQGDGGDLKITDVKDGIIYVDALNECSRCPLTMNCYKDWLGSTLNGYLGDAANYKVKITIKKPYFWDK